MQHILKPTQLKNNNRKCLRLRVTLQLRGSLAYQLRGIPLAFTYSFNFNDKPRQINFYKRDKALFHISDFSLCLCLMAHNESLASHFCFLSKQLPFITSVGGIPKSTCVFLVSAAHNSSSEAASCSVMVLVYFRALSLVTFHSSLALPSLVVGNVAMTD